MTAKISLLFVSLCLVGCHSSNQRVKDREPGADWIEYHGSGNRSHYSPLHQISKLNLDKLKVAWEYSSGGTEKAGVRTEMQCNPLIIKGVLYGVSAGTQAFALDAATGKEIWKTSIADNEGTTSRGVSYFEDSRSARIFFGAGQWLYAINAADGRLIPSFGDSGRIDLKPGLVRPGADDYVVSNTPNTIFKDLIITGARVSESETALLGDIRAFNVYTGKLAWTFRTIPAVGDAGYDTWSPQPREKNGGANSWAGMAIDRDRGIVYIPTGSAAFDFYGGSRKGDNLYANCLLALNAATGKLIWYYQLVHHDIWDRDPPAPPNLVTITRQGKKVDAVAQVTKQGTVFLFNRVTGQPIFDIEEKPVPMAAVPGEFPSATQPVPTRPRPFTRQVFTEKDFNASAAGHDSLVNVFRQSRGGTAYIPINFERTILYPSTGGGAQWGGAAADPAGILYVPGKDIPGYISLVKSEQQAVGASLTGSRLYQMNCARCHGADRTGNHDAAYPSLLNVGERLPAPAIENTVKKGRGMMPSFSHLPETQRTAIVSFLLGNKEEKTQVASKTTGGSPYQNSGYARWYDKNGYPVNTPPWGTLTAIDLNTGEHKWQVPLGEYKALVEKGVPPTGTDNYGGPLITGSGLVFIAATLDEKFRAFDKETGKLVWETQLPTGGYASPSTYSVNGKQFIVIACGGGKFKSQPGDKYVAFALQ